MGFSRVCGAADVAEGEALRVENGRVPVALFNVGGEFFATQDYCTHGRWSLSDGFLDGDIVECPLHMARFCVRDGSVQAPPARLPLKTFAVKVEDGGVYLDLDSTL